MGDVCQPCREPLPGFPEYESICSANMRGGLHPAEISALPAEFQGLE